MRSALGVVPLLIPVTANAGYISYEFIAPGTIQFSGELYATKIDGTYEDKWSEADLSGSGDGTGLELLGGLSSYLNINFTVSPSGQETVETSTAGMSMRQKREGFGDTAVELRFRLAEGRSYPLLIVGAVLPTGDDDEPIAEIRFDSELFQAGEAGGRGSGVTAYTFGAGYYSGAGSHGDFIGVKYTARGSNDVTHYGDKLALLIQSSYPITQSVSLVGSGTIQVTKDTESDYGHEETEPSVDIELGGMFSLSETTEIITTVNARTVGGKISHYNPSGDHESDSELRRATLSAVFRTRF